MLNFKIPTIKSVSTLNSSSLDMGIPKITSSTDNRSLKFGLPDNAIFTVNWNNISGKPSCFPPCLHSISLVTGTNTGYAYWDNTAQTWSFNSITSGVTSISAGTGISISGTATVPIVTNTAPDQTVTLSNGTGITISGTYPNFTITNSSPSSGGTVTSVAMSVPTGLTIGGSPITSSGTLALTFTAGYSIPTNASQTDWDTAYTNRITSANSPLSISANAISIAQATTSTSGYLTSTDWNTFNSKGSGVVTSITGTASRITIAGTAAIPTVDISTSYVGQATITTLGTITTGTWNGTVLTGQYGGTGVANTGKTITLAGNLTTTGAFNTSFTQQLSGTYTLPPVATATLAASAATLTSGRIPYVTTSGMLLDTANFLWDNTNMRLNVGNGATVPNSTTAGAWFSNNTTSAIVGLWLGQSSTNFGALFRYGSSYASNIFSGNTLLLSTDALLLYNNQGSAKAIYIATNNGIIVNVADISGAATVASTRLDNVGFKVSALSNANSAATSMLQTTGSFAAGVVLKTGSYTLAITDFTVIFDGATLTATLPAASTCTGRIYILVNRNATALTTSVAYNTLTTGVTSTTVTAASSVWIQSDGTNYYQIK